MYMSLAKLTVIFTLNWRDISYV